MRALAHRIALGSPSDVSALEALFDRGEIAPDEIVAVIGKTEGNGGRNDFSRELAVTTFADCIARRIGISRADVERRVVLGMSGGCEGVASPHAVIFGKRDDKVPAQKGHKRLAIATGHTRVFAPSEIGTTAQIDETARAVRAIAKGLVDNLDDVHLVQIKGAIPSVAKDDRAAPRNDMTFSRAASALGVGVALGEIDRARATDAAIASDFDLFSSVASVSAKPGLAASEIVVFANSSAWSGDLVIDHGVMRDILDTDALNIVLDRVGSRVVGVFAKAEAHPSKIVRGRRHVMLDDDDVSDTRWARCTLAAVLASVLGDTAVYVSTRAEHMGPLGGGPIAVIARVP